MIFKIKSSSVRVILDKEHIDAMVNFITVADMNETGGILLGTYSDMTTAIITNVVGPPPDSKSGRYWFFRGVKGLVSLLSKAWERNHYYIGEWHYHPKGTITPSPQDIRQMKKISKSSKYKCPEPIMVIIAGDFRSYEIGVFLTDKNFNMPFYLEPDA